MKTTVDQLEERTQWCFTEFAKQSVIGGMLGLLVSVIAFKRHAAVGLYGAGLGGGYALFNCSQSFEKMRPRKEERAVGGDRGVEEVQAVPIKEKITEEQNNLLEALQMLSAIKDKSQ